MLVSGWLCSAGIGEEELVLPISSWKEKRVTLSSNWILGVETSLAKSLWKVLAQVVEPVVRRRSGRICWGCAYGMSYQTPALGESLGIRGFAVLVQPGSAGMEVERPWWEMILKKFPKNFKVYLKPYKNITEDWLAKVLQCWEQIFFPTKCLSTPWRFQPLTLQFCPWIPSSLSSDGVFLP